MPVVEAEPSPQLIVAEKSVRAPAGLASLKRATTAPETLLPSIKASAEPAVAESGASVTVTGAEPDPGTPSAEAVTVSVKLPSSLYACEPETSKPPCGSTVTVPTVGVEPSPQLIV